MATEPLTVLVVGATGSIGRLVVEEAITRGHTVRVLVRDAAKGAQVLPDDAGHGDVTRPETPHKAVAGADAIVLTLGSFGAGGDVAGEHALVRRRGGGVRRAGGHGRTSTFSASRSFICSFRGYSVFRAERNRTPAEQGRERRSAAR
ncbi:NAD(P)H-binding protein, partial [Streptomyces mirabilis]